jgi:hypothetical protein
MMTSEAKVDELVKKFNAGRRTAIRRRRTRGNEV